MEGEGNGDIEREGDAGGGGVRRREGGGREREREREREKEKERDSNSDTLAGAAQSSRPPYNRCNTGSNNNTGSDSQSQSQSQLQSHHHNHQHNPQHNNNPHQSQHQHQHQQQQQQHQPPPHHRSTKHQKRVVGGGGGRFHARVPSSKGLHKSHSQSTTKLRSRANSPEPERPPQFGNAHRRTTSDLKLTAISNPAVNPHSNPASNSNSNSHSNSHSQSPAHQPLRKNTSHSNLPSKPSRPRPDIGKRSKSAAVIKRSSSHKDVQKLKREKNQVHFDLGNDDDDDADANEDEWVDASASASPYLSRRGSVVSAGQSPAKPPSPNDNHNSSRPQSPSTTDDRFSDHHDGSPTRETARHNNYITSRLLQRTPSHGAPPQMSTEPVSVHPPSGSLTSQVSRGPASLYGTPKTSTLGASGPEELISRFVNGSGPSSGGHGDHDSYFIPSHEPLRRDDGDLRRPQSLGNLHRPSRDSTSEDERALAPRPKTSIHRAPPASQSRTQQKLNLQRASSTIEPAQAGPGVGPVGPSLLVGSSDYEHRDPRISRLLERTGMEYLVVRRYQNPIARSIARLSHLPGAAASNNRRNIPQQNGNGTNGANTHGKNSLDTNGGGRLGLSQSMTQLSQQRSRPTTPRRPTSIRTTGARSSFETHEQDGPSLSGSSLVDGSDDNLAALLRNLWDKSTDLGASQD